MPRIPRIVAPGYPHHLTQRGNNRAQVFFDDEDRSTYISLLSNYAEQYRLDLLAWCLMDNHVHLLAIPQEGDSLARAVGLTNMVYTQYLNRKLGQSGRIWQNRFFSCPVESSDYLWSVARYIERNPVKAAMVASPDDYPYSSARAHLKGVSDPYLKLVDWLDTSEQAAYAAFVLTDDETTNEAIRRATRTGRPYGTAGFVESLEDRLGRRIKVKSAGRPRKKEAK